MKQDFHITNIGISNPETYSKIQISEHENYYFGTGILEVYTKLVSYEFMNLEWGCTLHLFVGLRFHFHFVPCTKVINGGAGWCCLRVGG